MKDQHSSPLTSERSERLHPSPDRGGEAAEVLRELIDARLLTSYEVREEDREPTRRVEIIHESLLANWPRLVRWQTQDADAAQLRDQLRQAAKTWDEHGRTDDMLWTGAAYREFASWRERYSGGLSELEEAFAAAMTSLATRRRRRRRIAVATVITALVVGLAIVSSFWRRSVLEARRAEAAKLLALAQVQLEVSPTEALVFTTASLELNDSEQARRMALEALAAGPPATLLVLPPVDDGDVAHGVVFSEDGYWAALAGYDGFRLVRRDGSVNHVLGPLPKNERSLEIGGSFDPGGARFLECRWFGDLRIWSLPDIAPLATGPLPRDVPYPWVTRRGVYAVSYPPGTKEMIVQALDENGQTRQVGRMSERVRYAIDAEGRWFVYGHGTDVMLRSLQNWELPPRRIGEHEAPVSRLRFAGDRVAAEVQSSELWFWPTDPGEGALGPYPIKERGNFFLDDSGDWLGVFRSQTDFEVEVWDLRGSSTSPCPAYRFPASVSAGSASGFFNGAAFVPGRDWVATAHVAAVAFWPLDPAQPKVLAENIPTGTGIGVRDLEFTPDGRQLLAVVMVAGEPTEIRVWDLEEGGPSGTLTRVSGIEFPQLAIDPRGRFAAVTARDAIEIVPLDGGPKRRLEGFTPRTWILDLAIDTEGRRVSAAGFKGPAEDKVIRIWDLQSGEVTVLGPIEGAGDGFEGRTTGLRLLDDGSLVSSGDGGLRLWNVDDGTCEIVRPGLGNSLAVAGRRVVNAEGIEEAGTTALIWVHDLDEGTKRILPSRLSGPPHYLATDPTGTIVVSAAFDGDGAVQVGSIDGDEPHLLLGHQRGMRQVAVSPDSRWIASAGHEGSVRLWPMPNLDKPPLHTLPREELIAKLKSLTNLRAVRDEESSTGWTIEVGPFPGWAEVPEW